MLELFSKFEKIKIDEICNLFYLHILLFLLVLDKIKT
jgi:hypothetical protein